MIDPLLPGLPRPSVRLTAVSGYAQPEDVARAIGAGFDGHVAKPPEPAQLESLLVRQVKRRRDASPV